MGEVSNLHEVPNYPLTCYIVWTQLGQYGMIRNLSLIPLTVKLFLAYSLCYCLLFSVRTFNNLKLACFPLETCF